MYIYNVTTNVDESIHDKWLNWMKAEHIPKMLATEKFTKAKISQVMIEEEMGGVTYAVQYTTDSLDTLEEYYTHFAEKLMNDNKRLDSSIYENQLLIVQKSNEIAGLTDRDLGLQKNVKTLENKINNLKSNYEKANNHADNFSSDQLSRYFTDSLR